MFAHAGTLQTLWDGFVPTADWRPFPDISDRAAWQKVATDPRLALSVRAILSQAAQMRAAGPEPLTGTMYMDFMRNGDRQAYEESAFRRRVALSHLVIAECLTAERTYLDAIIDHVWAILGEIYWCVPAHNFAGQHEMVRHKAPNPWKTDDPLPVPGDEYLDLFNCETAAILAEACYLLRPLLMAESPALYHLVHAEVERRTLAKIEGPDLYGWFHGHNNWTAWCAHNLLVAATYIIEDRSRLVSIAAKLSGTMQSFYDNLAPSGSCIEGPSYWVVSAGRLAGFAELISARFGGAAGLAQDARFRNFGEHILKLHIGENRFVNFADGAMKVDLDHGLIGSYARMIGSGPLATLVLEDIDRVAERKLARPWEERGHNEYNRQILIHLTRLLFSTPAAEAAEPEDCERSTWLGDMQVMVARSEPQPGRGLMLSAIAGSNDPQLNHHSHNDVGQFSIYADGDPLIVDLGQGAYSRATFSESRYDMWHISSAGHNVPQIGGLLQRAGTGAQARDVSYCGGPARSTLKLDAAPAYFEDPGERRILRRIDFDHNAAAIRIEDRLDLPMPGAVLLPLHVNDRTIEQFGPHACRISGTGRDLFLETEGLAIDRIEPVRITDIRHLEVWGPRLFRIVLRTSDPAPGRYALSFRLA